MNDKNTCHPRTICVVSPTKRCYMHVTPIATEFLDKDNNVVYTTGALPEGEVHEIKVTNKIVKHYKNGKLDGTLSMIDLTNDKVTLTEEYKDGVLLNVADFTNKDLLPSTQAAAAHEGTIVKVNKATQSFYVKGKEVAEQTVSIDGTTVEQLGEIPDGPVKELDENGQLRMETTYLNNAPQGILLRYNEQGQVLCKENYEDGKLNGPAQYFTYTLPQGTMTVQANYKDSKLDGEWTSSFPTGNICIKAFYKEGKLQGERLTLYNNGSVNIKETFENGKLDGVRFIYYENGNLWYQENYTNGKLEGARYGFFNNGNKFLEESYADDKLDGYRKTYDEEGHLLNSVEYHWGTLVHHTERQPLDK